MPLNVNTLPPPFDLATAVKPPAVLSRRWRQLRPAWQYRRTHWLVATASRAFMKSEDCRQA